MNYSPAPKYDCKVCRFGYSSVVYEGLNQGLTYKEILSNMRKKNATAMKMAKIKRTDLQGHAWVCLNMPQSKITITRRARKDIMKGKKTADEMIASVVGYISTALDLVENITPEEIKKLSPKDKFAIADAAAAKLQKAQEISLKAKGLKIEESKFLKQIGELAAGGGSLISGENEPIEPSFTSEEDDA